MNEQEKSVLVTQILRLCEKQYRKGFQHGFISSQENYISGEAVEDFRHQGAEEGYSKFEMPNIGNLLVGDNVSISKAGYLQKIQTECWMSDMEELQRLLQDVENLPEFKKFIVEDCNACSGRGLNEGFDYDDLSSCNNCLGRGKLKY